MSMGHTDRSSKSIVLDRSGKRLFVIDSFYGRHKVGSVLEFVTQGEDKILSTIKLSNVNNEDNPYVKKMLTIALKLGQCSCFLLQVTLSGCVQRNCGYIIFKDKSKYPVNFYTNDLYDTPIKRIDGPSDNTIKCVRGLLVLKRWTQESITKSQKFLVPTFIVAYNHLMNGVDKFDRVRTTNSCVRKEIIVYMYIFGFTLDSCIQNAYSILSSVITPGTKKMSFINFKRKIYISLISKQFQRNKKIIKNPKNFH